MTPPILVQRGRRSIWMDPDDAWLVWAGLEWEDLSKEAGVDPRAALRADWRKVAARVAAEIEKLMGQPVIDAEDYAGFVAYKYRERKTGADYYHAEGDFDLTRSQGRRRTARRAR